MKKILFISCTPVGRYMIEEIINNETINRYVEISGIVNLNNRVAIHKSNYDSYWDLIQKYELDIYYCEDVNESDCIKYIRSKDPDIIIQSGWSQKFSSELLEIPKSMCIGEHPAPLPIGRGAACVNWAIIKDYNCWGDTFFRMNNEFDGGDILAQESFEIKSVDNVKTVYDKVCLSSKNIIKNNLLKWVSGDFDLRKQEYNDEEIFKRRSPEDGIISFKDFTSSHIDKLIRAVTRPYPGAYFITKDKKKIFIWEAKEIKDSSYYQEEVAVINWANNSLVVKCKEGYIEIIRIQEENNPEMWGADWYQSTNKNSIVI